MIPLQAAETRQRVRTLTLQAEDARSVRALGKVNAIADTISAVAPLQLQPIARYYRAISLNRSGVGTPQSAAIFEALTECSLGTVRARAELALGSQAFIRGDHSLAHKHYATAKVLFALTPDPIGSTHLNRMLAVLHGVRGNHQVALLELQQTWKLAKTIRANFQGELYSILNSMSIELTALGYASEALPLINAALASPYAASHPEWIETKIDVERAAYRSSSVGMPRQMPRPVLDFCSRRQAKLDKLDYDQRCGYSDQIIHGCIDRIVEKNDLPAADTQIILRLLAR